ncbi:MAG: NAD(P)/FAD-dependent oxidoreductase [Acidimicrobiales bacterium]
MSDDKTLSLGDPVAAPQHVVVIGAGIVGLSCAWSLQDYGVSVTVVDRRHEAAGASAGNAGYVSPAHSIPLPEPRLLRYGLRAILDPRSPVSLPLRGDATRAKFLLELLAHCTGASWRRAMATYRPLNEGAIAAYDAQHTGGVTAEAARTDVISAFRHANEATGLLEEFNGIVGAGQSVDIELLTGERVRDLEPHLSRDINFGVVLRDQRYITPRPYVEALAMSVRERGGEIVESAEIDGVERRRGSVVARAGAREFNADAVVIANGAWLSRLASDHGATVPVYAGRGYSFTLPLDAPLTNAVHFPGTRLALTPAGERVRVVGVMEFTDPDAPLAPARINSMVKALKPLVTGVDWNGQADDWVGPRPLTPDGMPLIGRTATRGVYAAGGHGMWGVTLGPITGKLLAQEIATGELPAELAPFSPLRRSFSLRP